MIRRQCTILAAAWALIAVVGCQLLPRTADAQSATSAGQAAVVDEQSTEATATTTGTDGRITTEQAFRERLVGKRMVPKPGYFVIHSDGTMSGEFRGQMFTGTWSWEGEYFCREGRIGNTAIPGGCQVVIASGKDLVFVRQKGKGKKAIYRFEAAE